MTPEKTKEALTELCKMTRNFGATDSQRFDDESREIIFDAINYKGIQQLNHILFIATEAQKLLEENRVEKCMQHLGWIQGALWGMGLVSIAEMMDMNRSDSAT